MVHEPGLSVAPLRRRSLLHPARLLPSMGLGDTSLLLVKRDLGLVSSHAVTLMDGPEDCGCFAVSASLCESDRKMVKVGGAEL